MKQILILVASVLLLSSCKKDALPLPTYWKGTQKFGSGKCIRNGTVWEGSALGVYMQDDSTQFYFAMGTAHRDTMTAEVLGMVRIPLKLGTYKLINLHDKDFNFSTGCDFWIGYYDEIDAYWQVAINRDSYVTVDSYDTVGQVVRGRFQAYLNREEGLNYPDNISFENGTYEAKLIR